ncbi:hypothetical protein D1816_04285 [Aquimarina sp. AD10]|uniref:M23/M56 family metallopeptidase n=1 Tax=Aquimarina sp. AD10 TaxID=1714849 RepID=UPI000E47B786|nr:M23/M56 family metallopeptidase [Aquimarina sp. AD10]AXT59603.1 hypothetical protein D1816_04285 [Aquimarina sp. AD10]RKM94716.1 hypothetical protein D7033_17905 [Aquimarina sp. AD10]
MTNLFLYIIQTAFIFSVLYILFVLFLKQLTFHHLNRIILLLLLPISLLIPLTNGIFPSSFSDVIIEVPLFDQVAMINTDIVDIQGVKTNDINSSFNYLGILITIYLIVVAIYLLRFFLTAKNLFLLKRRSYTKKENGYKLVIADVANIFSYFDSIFIPKQKIKTYDEYVLAHERMHIKLKHSIDVIITEIYIAFFWFNPLSYLYRKSLKSVHEFQADKGVLQKGVKTSDYMQLLMQTLEVQKPNNLYNYFKQPILKQRVIMMTKPKSNNLAKLKYSILLLMCIFLISAFTKPNISNKNSNDIEFVTILNVLDACYILEDETLPPSLFPVQNGTKENITSHFGVKRKHPKINKGVAHGGIDIRATPGTPVIATADGIISKASLEGDWGNLIIISHADDHETWYAHLQGFNIKEEQSVKKGEIIGYVGNTGLSTGPHLHYEVKYKGKRVNPLDYIN